MRNAVFILFFAAFYFFGASTVFSNTITDSTFVSKNDSINRYVTIDKIFVIGNKTTKDNIIYREITFQRGDEFYLETLKEIIKEDQNKVYNTGLFNSVEINILELNPEQVDIVIKVDERWYLFPIPLFKFIDRNFNDWIVNRNADFSRVVYGLKLNHYNMRGRNEKLGLKAEFGYANSFGISYKIPYVEKTQRHGISFSAYYNELKNLAVISEDHVRQYLEEDKTLSENYSFGAGYIYRAKISDFHFFGMDFRHAEITDTVAQINPNFFSQGQLEQDYIYLSYQYRKDKRDIQSYPLKGYQIKANISKYGIGVYDDLDYFSLKASVEKYFDLGNQFYLSNYLSGFVSSPDNRPYSSYSAMGTGLDLVRGYELSLIEAPRYFVAKTTFKKKLIGGSRYWEKFPIPQFRTIPYAIYLKTYVDFGYAQNFTNYENNSRLTNKLIAGGGIGLDFVTLYDAIFRIEYTINAEQQTGIYLHFWQGF